MSDTPSYPKPARIQKKLKTSRSSCRRFKNAFKKKKLVSENEAKKRVLRFINFIVLIQIPRAGIKPFITKVVFHLSRGRAWTHTRLRRRSWKKYHRRCTFGRAVENWLLMNSQSTSSNDTSTNMADSSTRLRSTCSAMRSGSTESTKNHSSAVILKANANKDRCSALFERVGSSAWSVS